MAGEFHHMLGDGRTASEGLTDIPDMTQEADSRVGTEFEDKFLAYGGDDVIHGRGGNDWIEGGLDDNTLYGGKGNDRIFGGGNDKIVGGQGGDSLYAGGGETRLIYQHINDGGDNVFYFETGVDKIKLKGEDFAGLGQQDVEIVHGLFGYQVTIGDFELFSEKEINVSDFYFP